MEDVTALPVLSDVQINHRGLHSQPKLEDNMLRVLLTTTALIAMPVAVSAQDATENQQAQAQREATISSGGTVVVETFPERGTVQLNFQFVDSMDLGSSQDVSEQDTSETAQQDEQMSSDLTESETQASGDAQAQSGMEEKRVTDGGVIRIETPQGSQATEVTLRFEPAQDRAADQASAQDTQTSQVEGQQAGDFTADDLIGSEVRGANDENIGNVGDVALTADGEIDALIVDVGGFLGIGTHTVAIGLDNLEVVGDGDNWVVHTPFSEEELKNQPEYNPDTYAGERDQQRLMAQ